MKLVVKDTSDGDLSIRFDGIWIVIKYDYIQDACAGNFEFMGRVMEDGAVIVPNPNFFIVVDTKPVAAAIRKHMAK